MLRIGYVAVNQFVGVDIYSVNAQVDVCVEHAMLFAHDDIGGHYEIPMRGAGVADRVCDEWADGADPTCLTPDGLPRRPHHPHREVGGRR